ncbi:hypothetical protein GF319_06015 [Candidatus Bathyarchaeota archaeon]|nr:hypothetical protein [Candidatus Bathyarchaeota archaeon]
MEKQRNSIIRDFYSIPIIGLILSVFLTLAALYQLEIILIWVSRGRHVFEFPFFLWSTSVWIARDIWYGILVVGLAIGIWSGFKLGESKDYQALLEQPGDLAILRELIELQKKNLERNLN